MTPGDPTPEAPASSVSMPQHLAPFSSKRVLEPIERISEVIVGLLVVLAFTGAFSVAGVGRYGIRPLLLGALACTLAWAILDGIMYLMGCLARTGRSLALLRAVRTAAAPEKAQRLLAEAMPPLVTTVLQPSGLESLSQQLRQLPEPPAHPRLSKSDWLGAVGVIALVFPSTLPVVAPFFLMQNPMRALRLSDAIAVLMLFLAGFAFGRRTGYRSELMAIACAVLGAALAGLTIVLGG